jgi:hypothetical protein
MNGSKHPRISSLVNVILICYCRSQVFELCHILEKGDERIIYLLLDQPYYYCLIDILF